ncbi:MULTISPECIES: sigma-70 family RNA polymerase sigma factor [Catenuloplanes]|uniref:RNA polymerase sigma-70 factor (ECF subfamily) n=1 Tax=Catenuloplanes niger TaxID=587534 RepID=A0AAE4CTF6_9ACTN|nr:sigma-70 family RNA polymerase sigma factor [Catenuloplanes niger]MDR7320669.1 RNA polymerase sigma-70 factor (ECF subfamily) [Catenuloplanes niger]
MTAGADKEIETDGRRRPGANADAWLEDLHAVHADPLFWFLLKLAKGERQLAEDQLQETMLRAWRNMDDVPEGRESQRRWLFTVARRVAIDAARARASRLTEVGTMDLTWIPDEVDPTEAVVAGETVRAALPRISAEHRTILVALYIDGLTIGEVAAGLGIAEGTVKSRAHYGLRALRAAIGTVEAE